MLTTFDVYKGIQEVIAMLKETIRELDGQQDKSSEIRDPDTR